MSNETEESKIELQKVYKIRYKPKEPQVNSFYIYLTNYLLIIEKF